MLHHMIVMVKLRSARPEPRPGGRRRCCVWLMALASCLLPLIMSLNFTPSYDPTTPAHFLLSLAPFSTHSFG